MKLLRVLETHVVGDIHFIKGKLVDAAHPLIVGREHFFEEVKADIVHVEDAVKSAVASEAPVVEKDVESAEKRVEGDVASEAPVVEKDVEDAAKVAVKDAAVKAVL